MTRSAENKIKIFGMTNQLIVEDLSQIQNDHDLELGHVSTPVSEEEQRYYSQFDRSTRLEAAKMARHYEIFYCLERSIRDLISETLQEVAGDNWWSSGRIPTNIADDVRKLIKKEVDSGMTRRSQYELDYTTFGQLSAIITGNWDLFDGILTSPRAVERILGNLNSLRGPIAHCSPLAEDEVVRLQLSLRDWFRQME